MPSRVRGIGTVVVPFADLPSLWVDDQRWTPLAGLVARYGGDELAVLLPDSTLEEAEHLGRQLLGISREPVAIGSVTLDVGFSTGIAVATTPHDPTDFLAQADRAAHRAKAEGRGRLVSVDLDAIAEPQLT